MYTFIFQCFFTSNICINKYGHTNASDCRKEIQSHLQLGEKALLNLPKTLNEFLPLRRQFHPHHSTTLPLTVEVCSHTHKMAYDIF